MEHAGRIILWFVFAALGLTLISSGLIWWFESTRRLSRALIAALGKFPDAVMFDVSGRKAAGLDFTSGNLSVMWDTGNQGLVYEFDEIEGAELIVDEKVVGRAQKGEPRRVLDETFSQATGVTLRLIFNDVEMPEFELCIFGGMPVPNTSTKNPTEAVRLGRKWLSHIDAVLKRGAGQAYPPPKRPEAPENLATQR